MEKGMYLYTPGFDYTYFFQTVWALYEADSLDDNSSLMFFHLFYELEQHLLV